MSNFKTLIKEETFIYDTDNPNRIRKIPFGSDDDYWMDLMLQTSLSQIQWYIYRYDVTYWDTWSVYSIIEYTKTTE